MQHVIITVNPSRQLTGIIGTTSTAFPHRGLNREPRRVTDKPHIKKGQNNKNLTKVPCFA